MSISKIDKEISQYITRKPDLKGANFNFFRWTYTEIEHHYDEFSCGIKEVFEGQIWSVYVKVKSEVRYIKIYNNLEDVKKDYYTQLKKYGFISHESA